MWLASVGSVVNKSFDLGPPVLIGAAHEHISRDRTTIAIAHRLFTIRGADRIRVLERGRVVELARHDELVDGGGVYAALWRGSDRGARGGPPRLKHPVLIIL